MFEYSVIVTISKQGKASKILSKLKEVDVKGGTIVYGKGTASNEILKFFEYTSIKKEILFTVIKKERENEILEYMSKCFNFHKPNTGIAFSMPLIEVVTTNEHAKEGKKENLDMEYEVVFVVVDNHRGDEVVSIANRYGAKGATIIHGRGSGVHEKGSIFNITIEPEKEIVMMLIKANKHQEVVDGLSKELDIKSPGNGIIFSASVNQALGLVE